MNLSRELEEAVYLVSDDDILSVMSEDVLHSIQIGSFSPEGMKEAFVGILGLYGLTESDADIVEEAVEEFCESMELTEKFMKWLKKASKDALKAVGKAALDAAKEGGKEAVSTSAKELQKRLKTKQEKEPGEKEPKKKPKDDDDDGDDIKKNLKDIAGKALGKIADDPSKAKKVLKKHGKEAVRALAKHGVKKGMKMVFGRWVKAKGGDSKKEAIEWFVSHSNVHNVSEEFDVYDFDGEVPEWIGESLKSECGGLDENRRYEIIVEKDGTVQFMMSEVRY